MLCLYTDPLYKLQNLLLTEVDMPYLTERATDSVPHIPIASNR